MSDAFQPAGNYYDKYATRNPVARALMQGFLRAFDELVGMVRPVDRALEVGCGEGELSMRLARSGWSVQACDIADAAVIEAQERIKASGLAVSVRQCDIRDALSTYSRSDLVVCCEVLEHLEDTTAALDCLVDLTLGHLLVSVPREPIWRVMNLARGRYITDLGNTPGHIQHWGRRQFLDLLKSRFDIVAVRSPLPWTMVLCRLQHAQ